MLLSLFPQRDIYLPAGIFYGRDCPAVLTPTPSVCWVCWLHESHPGLLPNRESGWALRWALQCGATVYTAAAGIPGGSMGCGAGQRRGALKLLLGEVGQEAGRPIAGVTEVVSLY